MGNLRNSVRLTGNVGNEPEVKITGNHRKMAKFNLAVNHYRKNEQGEKVKETTWLPLVLREKQAEIAELYLHKGSGVSVEGRLVNRFYTDKDGVKRQSMEIVVSELLLIGKKQVD